MKLIYRLHNLWKLSNVLIIFIKSHEAGIFVLTVLEDTNSILQWLIRDTITQK